eukprot:13446_1
MTHRFVVSTTKVAIHSNIFRFKPSSSIFKSQQSRYAFCNFISLNRQTPYVGNQFRYFSAANSEDHVITDEQRRKYKERRDARIEELEKLTGAPKELVQKAIFQFPNLQRSNNLAHQKLYIEEGNHGYEKKHGKFVKMHKEVHKESHDEKNKDSDDEDSVHSEHKQDSHHEKHKRTSTLFQYLSHSKKVESMLLSDEFINDLAHIYEPMYENERTRAKSIKVVTNVLSQMNDDNFVKHMIHDDGGDDDDGDLDEDEEETKTEQLKKKHVPAMKKEAKHMLGSVKLDHAAHKKKKKTMFADMKKILDSTWFTKRKNKLKQ